MEELVERVAMGNVTEVKVLIVAVAIVVVTAHFGPTSAAELESREERQDQQLDQQEERREERQERQEEQQEGS